MERSEKKTVERYEDLPPAADQRMVREAGVAYEPAGEGESIDLREVERLSRQQLWEPVMQLPKRGNDDFEPAPEQEQDTVEGL